MAMENGYTYIELADISLEGEIIINVTPENSFFERDIAILRRWMLKCVHVKEIVSLASLKKKNIGLF